MNCELSDVLFAINYYHALGRGSVYLLTHHVVGLAAVCSSRLVLRDAVIGYELYACSLVLGKLPGLLYVVLGE